MSPFTCFATIALVLGQFYLTEAQFGGGFQSNGVSGGGFASHSSSGFDRGFGVGGGGFNGGHIRGGQFGGGQFGGGHHHFGGGGHHFGAGGHSSGFQTNTVVEGRWFHFESIKKNTNYFRSPNI